MEAAATLLIRLAMEAVALRLALERVGQGSVIEQNHLLDFGQEEAKLQEMEVEADSGAAALRN